MLCCASQEDQTLLEALEACGPDAFGASWGAKLESGFVHNLGRYLLQALAVLSPSAGLARCGLPFFNLFFGVCSMPARQLQFPCLPRCSMRPCARLT
jgi:hypothetical protein